jgi:hypothetical protein
MKRFDPELVEVAFASSRKAVNDFQGRKTRGTEHEFEVVDRNFPSRNLWRFALFVPGDWRKGTYLSLRPLTTPNRKAWSGLERRSIQLAPCTRGGYRGNCYGVVYVSDPTGSKTRRVLTRKDVRPAWLDEFMVSTKARVATSRANDGDHLAAVFDRDDFAGMIRLFVAARAWTLSDGFSKDDAALARRLAKERALRARRKLNGVEVCVTGKLGLGNRQKVIAFLRKHGAVVRARPLPDTDLLIEGAHPLGDARLKVQGADAQGVVRISEAQFRRKFAV